MPVTKKKGAIFAIYADSPIASSHDVPTTLSSQTSPSRRTRYNVKVSVSTNNNGGAALSERKALSAKQASVLSSSTKGFPSEKSISKPLTSSGSEVALKESNVPSVNLKSSAHHTAKSSSSTSTTKKRPPVKSGPTKRQLEFFTSPPTPTTSTFTKPALPSRNSQTSKVRFEDGNTSKAKQYESPAKKGRTASFSTPSKATSSTDKENQPPALDSPASRTRSKTRANRNKIGSISSLAGLGIESPVSQHVQTTISASTSRNGVPLMRRGPEMEGLAVAEVDEIEHIVGSGRGALSLKKGRALAEILGSRVDLGDDGDDLDLLTSEGSFDGSPKKSGAGFGKGSKGKGFWVKGDGPLADVSEAYGATGVEPEGFRVAGERHSAE